MSRFPPEALGSRLSRLGAPVCLFCLLYCAACVPTLAASLPVSTLADFSLEQLSDIIVSSVSRQDEPLSNVAASVFVITGEDIRRAGAESIPEALRLAPNLQVARVDGRNYAISARGFSGPFANKMLVLIDGRSVYSPLFSGVFWDAQDVMMEDVERIEVISGPGATFWGANAVNGVINVITRAAGDTQGGVAYAGKGKNGALGAVRYGGAMDNGGHYRVYGKVTENDDTFTETGINTRTGSLLRQAGFRTDMAQRGDVLTMQGDAYTGDLGQFGTDNIRIAGANLLGRYTKKLSDHSGLRIQAYLDHTERDQPNAFKQRLDTLDLDIQHDTKLASIHHFTWGAGYRYAWDRIENGAAFGFLPGHLDMHWANLFAQDEIAFTDSLRLTMGLRLEHNNYAGLESLPNLRIGWNPAKNHLLWAAISRTVRAPSRIDRDLFAPTNPPVVGGTPRFAIGGGPDFVSETAKVFEIGYRGQLAPDLTYSVTGFYSDYDKLRTLEPLAGGGSVFDNNADGSARGVEMWSTWQPVPQWRLSGGLVAQKTDVTLKPESRDAGGAAGFANNDPRRYWMIRSSHDITPKLTLDATLRYVGELARPVVPSYHEMDVRLGWKVHRDLELSLVGQNLLDSAHAEFGDALGRSRIERSVFVKILVRFQ